MWRKRIVIVCCPFSHTPDTNHCWLVDAEVPAGSADPPCVPHSAGEMNNGSAFDKGENGLRLWFAVCATIAAFRHKRESPSQLKHGLVANGDSIFQPRRLLVSPQDSQPMLPKNLHTQAHFRVPAVAAAAFVRAWRGGEPLQSMATGYFEYFFFSSLFAIVASSFRKYFLCLNWRQFTYYCGRMYCGSAVRWGGQRRRRRRRMRDWRCKQDGRQATEALCGQQHKTSRYSVVQKLVEESTREAKTFATSAEVRFVFARKNNNQCRWQWWPWPDGMLLPLRYAYFHTHTAQYSNHIFLCCTPFSIPCWRHYCVFFAHTYRMALLRRFCVLLYSWLYSFHCVSFDKIHFITFLHFRIGQIHNLFSFTYSSIGRMGTKECNADWQNNEECVCRFIAAIVAHSIELQ